MTLANGTEFEASGTAGTKETARAKALDNAMRFLTTEAPEDCQLPLETGSGVYHQDAQLGYTYETRYAASISSITISNEDDGDCTLIWRGPNEIRAYQGSDRYTGNVVDRRSEDNTHYVVTDRGNPGGSDQIEFRLRDNYLKIRLVTFNSVLGRYKNLSDEQVIILKNILGVK